MDVVRSLIHSQKLILTMNSQAAFEKSKVISGCLLLKYWNLAVDCLYVVRQKCVVHSIIFEPALNLNESFPAHHN